MVHRVMFLEDKLLIREKYRFEKVNKNSLQLKSTKILKLKGYNQISILESKIYYLML